MVIGVGAHLLKDKRRSSYKIQAIFQTKNEVINGFSPRTIENYLGNSFWTLDLHKFVHV